MEKQYTSVEEQVEYGLDTVAEERIVEMPLRDLLYVYQTLGELIRFFHQPLHFPDLEAVKRFLGDRNNGAFHLLSECYYEKLYGVWPKDIDEAIREGGFDNPGLPYYYKPNDT